MAVLPTDRTTANTDLEHADDHNELHTGHNLNETHRGRTDNPHAVTKTQVGLGNVDNTSDASKPVSTATQTALDGKAASAHTHALYEETGMTMGKAGTISATESDAADFLIVAPFNMTLRRIKASRKTHGLAASVVQIRLSTDDGASYADAFGSATFGSLGLVASADPANLDVDEGDVLNFSVATGGGTNLLVEVVAIAR